MQKAGFLTTRLILSLGKEGEWPSFGKEMLTLFSLPNVLFISCLFVVIVISDFGLEDRILVLIVALTFTSITSFFHPSVILTRQSNTLQ